MIILKYQILNKANTLLKPSEEEEAYSEMDQDKEEAYFLII